jgi:tetratricopeptide (TPR) repeat protein
MADFLFSRRRFNEASENYKISLQRKEPGELYTLLNGAQVFQELNQYDTCLLWLAQAKKISSFDSSYFESCSRQILFRSSGLQFFDDIKKIILDENSTKFNHTFFSEDFDLTLIAGFPRCATSSIYMELSKSDIYYSGYVDEVFPSHLISKIPINSCFDIYEENLKTSIELNNFDFFENGPKLKFIDKSTVFSLSLPLLEHAISRYKKIMIYISLRDPVDRAISAFQMTRASLQLSPEECLTLEMNLIEKLGGANSIFESFDRFCTYCNEISTAGILHPIIYPSILMHKFNQILPKKILHHIKFIHINPFDVLEYKNLISIHEVNIKEWKNSSNFDDASVRLRQIISKFIQSN